MNCSSFRHINVLLSVFFIASNVIAAPTTISDFIKIDHFGYRTNAEKIAVISDPQIGFNSALAFSPGNTYQIRDWNTDAIVFSGSTTVWNGGATHTKSGDKVWYFDFSTLSDEGSYYVFDVTNNVGSVQFEINDCVYQNVLKTACRTFYYQRCGTSKALPFAEADWTDVACHVGANQDTDCRLWSAPNDPTTSKDLSGGWHNSNDYGKYVNLAWEPVLHLLLAYEESPSSWTDDFNTPESGNGIPDILDEVKIELDWLLKMQQSDGSVLSVVGTNDYESSSPPSEDAVNDFRRYYGPATTHASFSAAGMFALAAIQFESVGDLVYASNLENAAVNAWNWALANPDVVFHNNNQDISIGPLNDLGGPNQEGWEGLVDQKQLVAAIYLFALTENTDYKSLIDANANISNLNFHGSDARYIPINDALLYYTNTAGGTTSIQNQIRNYYSLSIQAGMNNLPTFSNQTDAYRAYISNFNWDSLLFLNEYPWGSNNLKSLQGISYQNMQVYNLNAANATNYKNASSGYLHYFHGVNPLSKLYLSNMSSHGGENSIQGFYHNWFSYGTEWAEVNGADPGPAPGFTVLGPNENYELYTCCATNCEPECANVANLLNDPAQKCYQDFNLWYPYAPWSMTANENNLQASYVRLLSKFYDSNCANSSSISEKEKAEFSFYPNPSKDFVQFQLNDNASHNLEILDMLGSVLLVTEVKNESKVDVSSLRNGVYFMRIKDKGTMKLVKI